ncbi:MAG TPA: hypothetical protein PKI03_39000, partial [Pseudomonadota bacterium]|nr:hypothetical protein [Pseudomonadota bacterium]
MQEISHLVPPDPFFHFNRNNQLKSHQIVAYVFNAYWLFKLGGFDEWQKIHKWPKEHCDEVLNQMA